MVYPIRLEFNQQQALVMHIDINSCFATVEQQANPLLRGKPIAVAAYTTANGCILAPSIEAKERGIRLGMRVREGKELCPDLIVMSPDPDKYRYAHLKLKELLKNYVDKVVAKSIDEFVLDFKGFLTKEEELVEVGKEIKIRILKEVGDWFRVSIGLGPNRFLAKMASGLEKPDGLEVINKKNYQQVYERLFLTDLYGINKRLEWRLNEVGIYTVKEFVQAEIQQLKAAFGSISSYYWYLRLRGWEIDEVSFSRKSFGHSYSLPKSLTTEEEVAPILRKMTEKVCWRMRRAGFEAKGVHLAVRYKSGGFWHKGVQMKDSLYDSKDVFGVVSRLWRDKEFKEPVGLLAVTCFGLIKRVDEQLFLFEEQAKEGKLVESVDAVNERWGELVLGPALMMEARDKITDRIGFGRTGEIGHC